MRVTVIMPLAEQRGGSELMLLQLLQNAGRSDIHWLVVFLKPGPMVEQAAQLGADVRVIDSGRLANAPRFLFAVASIAALLRKHRTDIVVGWLNFGHLLGGLAAALSGVPAVWYQLGIPIEKHWLDRLVTALPARAILTCSQAGGDAQLRMKPARPIRIVYPGVSLDRFDPQALPNPTDVRQPLGLKPGGPVVGIVGRLQRWKGMHVLVEAMPALIERFPEIQCVLVGGEHKSEPDYPAYLRSRIADLHLEDRVMLTGLQSNVPLWMQAMDVVVHASDREPFGIVIIEAMALAKPVVAGDQSGPREIITDGVDGLLSPYGDSESLADRIGRILGDHELACAMGNKARIRAQDFSVRRYASDIVKVLEEFV